jgi:hypothetical protein
VILARGRWTTDVTSLLRDQHMVCAKKIEYKVFDVDIPRSSIPIMKATRRDELALILGHIGWEVELH